MLLEVVAPHTAGDPMSHAKWLNCRLTDIRRALSARGHLVSKPVISRLCATELPERFPNARCLLNISVGKLFIYEPLDRAVLLNGISRTRV